MAPQVGLERCPEILTAEVILLIFRKNARKTSVDAGFERVNRLSLKSGKAAHSEIGRTKVGHFFRRDSVGKPSKEPSKMDGSLDAKVSPAGRSDNRLEAILRTTDDLDAVLRFAAVAQSDAFLSGRAGTRGRIGARIDRAALHANVVM